LTKDFSNLADLTYIRGRVALAECLKALGIGTGDRVAVQAFTCVAVPEAVMAVGATPHWIDVSENSVNMSAQSLSDNWHKDIKAVIIQHTFGIMADMPALLNIIADRVPIIEDCCHTFLSNLEGRLAGRFGVASFYSFEWGKPVIIGLGGAALVNDNALYDILAKSRSTFRSPKLAAVAKMSLQRLAFSSLYRPSLYWTIRRMYQAMSRLGLAIGNYNPLGPGELSDDFQTLMPPSDVSRLTRKLPELEKDAKRRESLAKYYASKIAGYETVKPITSLPGANDILVRYPVYVDNKQIVLERAQMARVEAAGWYTSPIHPLSKDDWQLVGYQSGSCPIAEHMANHIVSFPLSSGVTRRTINALDRIFNS